MDAKMEDILVLKDNCTGRRKEDTLGHVLVPSSSNLQLLDILSKLVAGTIFAQGRQETFALPSFRCSTSAHLLCSRKQSGLGVC